MSQESFSESSLRSLPIRDLGLRIEGTRLEPIAQTLLRELKERGVLGVTPRFYLSTEWGVAFGTISIAIPFYLARPELEALHLDRDGHIEGQSDEDILGYLRHEMGHVVGYAHKLYALEEWVQTFGAITEPYIEEYKPLPFDRRFVTHLPGWYAQKHPDEDWAETFAVWLTPGLDWRVEYADRPQALAKLELCDRLLQIYGRQPAEGSDDSLDEDVSGIGDSLEDFYSARAGASDVFPQALDGALLAIFYPARPAQSAAPAAELLRELERPLLANVYRWTGHFPERTRTLMRHLEARAETLKLFYDQAASEPIKLAVTTLVTALAMNHIYKGSYIP